MRDYKFALGVLLKLNIVQTMRANRRAGKLFQPGVFMLNKTWLKFKKGAAIEHKNGPALFNYSWYGPNKEWSLLYMHQNSRLILNGALKINKNFDITINPGATLEFGENVGINNNAQIHCYSRIKIGDNTFIGEGFSIRDHDNHAVHHGTGNQRTSDITIGKHVWIATGCSVLKGVTIGDNAVIATGAVVTKDIPANCLAGGVPAKVIRENISWTDK